jgi:outer membrane usher protein
MNRLLFLFTFWLALGYSGNALAAGDDNGIGGNIDVALIVDGKKAAETWINISAGGASIEIPAAPVLSALAAMVGLDVLHSLEARITPNGTLTNRILSRWGISLSFNAPLRQAILGLAKDAPAPNPQGTPAPAPPVPPPVAVEKEKAPDAPKAQDHAGPWTTAPTNPFSGKPSDSAADPAGTQSGLSDGKGEASGASNDTPSVPVANVATDEGWEPVYADSMRLGAVPDGQGSPGKPGVPAAAPNAPRQPVQLESYRYDQTRDELFEEVFKRKPPPVPLNVEVTLLVDGKSYGSLWLLFNKEQKRYTFPVEPVLNALQGLVRPDLFAKLQRRAEMQTRFTVDDLIESGFPTTLNTSVFELSTGVPAQLLGTKALSLAPKPVDPSTVPVVEPAALSAFLNARFMQRISYAQYNPSPYDSNEYGKRTVEARNKEPRQPAIANMDGAVNLKGWVLEGKGIVREKPELNAFEFSRQEIRMVHDWPRQSLRLTAGDLTFPTSGFQSFMKLGGIGLSRDFSLQPHLIAYPVKDFEFYLANPAEVKIYINGALKGTFRLDPGPHDLTGFPVTAGESEVEVHITDYTGQTQVLNFSFIHEASLLAEGRSSFSFNVGLPSRDTYTYARLENETEAQEILNYEYDMGHPAMFLDYKRGVTDQFTLEGYSQALDTAGMVGINSLLALRIGKIAADAAGSFRQGDLDWAGKLEYTYIPKLSAKSSPTSWRFMGQYLGKDFYRQGQDPSLLGSLTFAGSFQKSASIATANLGLSYSLRPDSADFYNAFLSVRKNWKQGISADMSLKNTFDRQKLTNTSVSVSLNYFFYRDQHSIGASQRVENHRNVHGEPLPAPDWDYTTDLAWDYNSSAPFPQNPSAKAIASFGPAANDYNAEIEWKGNQGIAGIQARRNEPKTYSIINNYVDLNLQSTLVFADWNVALSRPVANSFLLVKGIENEEACDILVNPGEIGYDAKSTEWLPGVAPLISSYYLKKIHLEVVDPPFGSEEERTDFTIYPGYKSGYALYMGTKASVIALGTLLLGPGEPAVYQTFTATAMDGKPQDPVSGFTNAAGKFQLSRLQPGRYKIEMEVAGKPYSLVMKLPKDASGILSVGPLTLEPK